MGSNECKGAFIRFSFVEWQVMRVGHLCQFDHEFYDNHVYDSFDDIFDVEFDEDDDR